MGGTGCKVPEIHLVHDKAGNTLTVWFGDPEEEHICEETGNEIVLMKDKGGRVIGFEKLNFALPSDKQLRLVFETT